MRSEDPAAGLFIPAAAGQRVAITAAARGITLGAVAERYAARPGVTVEDVNRDGVTGRLFLPPGPGPHPGVTMFGGSEGGVDSMSQDAGLLASHGYAAFVAGYFGLPGLPPELAAIPLERLAGAVRWLAAHSQVRADRLAGLGISKGAEGLLAAAAHVRELPLRAIVAISPSHLVWQAVGQEGPEPGVSSWTLGGSPVPFAPVNGEALMPELLRNALRRDRDRRRGRPTLLHLAPGYALGNGEPPDAVIPAERITAPLLCLTGQADAVWPSAAMADALLGRRRSQAAAAVAGDEHRSYPGAGHLIRFPYLPTAGPWAAGVALGGSPDGLAAAQADAGPRILRFLAGHTGTGDRARGATGA
jgi:dienelactone hydrolase